MNWWYPEEFLKRKKLPFLLIESRPFTLQRELFASPWATLRFTLRAPVTGPNRGPGLSYSCHSSKRNILSCLEETVPGYYQLAPAIHPPAKALRRYIVRSSLIVTVVVAAAFWILELNFLIWILPALSILWGWLRYKAAAVGRHPDFFILRSRFISRSTAFIRRNRVQDMTLHQSIIQRYRGLCTL